uniref:CHK domain-containing protein n=1 Tax=Strongyloides papillosus TaxID=174720 RepID=A0A0N5B888_STREA
MTANSKLEESYIDKTNIKVDCILKCLEDKCSKYRETKGDSKVVKINTFDVSNGNGYVSRILKTTIFFDDIKKEPFICVIKVPSAENFVKLFSGTTGKFDEDWECTKLKSLAMFHNNELKFYKNMSKKIGEITLPVCYGGFDIVIGSQDGAIIMEYLTSSSGCISSHETLNIFQVKSVLNELLKLHVYSLTTGKEEKKIFKHKYGKEHSKIYVSLFNSHWESIKNVLSEQFINELESNYTKYIEHYINIYHYYIYKLPFISGNYSVLCHGDLWINNLMYKRDLKGHLTNDIYAIIDWQTVYEGSIGVDLARLLVQCTSPEDRHKIETTLLPKYYEDLKKNSSLNDKDFNMTYDMFMHNYNICLIDQAFHNITMISLIITELEKNEDIYNFNAKKDGLCLRLYWNLKDAFEKLEKIGTEFLNEIKI